MLNKEDLKGLYVLTDATLTPDETMLEQIERVLKSGVRVIQYRNKYATAEEAEKQCIRLQALCDVYEAIFIIDDRLDIAYRINADGLHVGEDDVSYEEARVVSPEILQSAKEQLRVPICAIGGINENNIELLSCYDIAMYSLISAVYKEDAIEENLEKLHAKI